MNVAGGGRANGEAASGQIGRTARRCDDEAPSPWVFCGRRRLPVPRADAFEPPPRLTPAEDPDWTLSCALAAPLASPPLQELAAAALRSAPSGAVVLAVPDGSRACPTPLVVEHLLAELAAGGVDDGRVAVVIGCGLHATTSATARRALVGERVAARVEVVDAQAQDGPFVDLGTTRHGVPTVVHRRVAQAALVVAVGVVEPHLYAGFSGGVKAVSIGCAGEATIAATHDPRAVSAPGVTLGRLDGNPFQETLREIAARTPLRFAVNAVADEEGRPTAVVAGDPVRAQASLARAHRAAWLRAADRPADVVVAGVPAPKSESLYQASRAFTYLALQERPVVAEGGTVVLCADLPRGPGDGPAERNFAALLAGAEPAALVARGLREPLGPGGQRAFVVARALRHCRLSVVGAEGTGRPPAVGWLDELGIEAAATLEDALAATAERLGRRPRVLAVADAMTTVVHLA